MTTNPSGNMRADHEGRQAVADTLTQGAAWLRLRGHGREAESVLHLRDQALDCPNPATAVAPGLSALMMWARREETDPLLVRAGDRVRVFTRNGAEITTGVWCRRPGIGTPIVQRDDDGEDLAVDLAVHRIELLWLDKSARTRSITPALWDAATVIRSAWLPRPGLDVEPHPLQEWEQEFVDRAEYLKHRERQRLCPCGEPARSRVIAWTAVESVEDADVAEGLAWEDPAELGAETVCSTGCGHGWAHKFFAEAELPDWARGKALRFRLENYRYQAEPEEVPVRLGQARAAASRAANLLDGACTAHVADEQGSVQTLTQSARASVAELLDAVLMLTTPKG